MTLEQLAALLHRLDDKNSWEKNEVRNLILEIIAGIKK